MPKARIFFSFILLIFLTGGGFLAGSFFEKAQAEICPDQEINLSLFWQTWRLLKEKYVNPDQFNTEKMIYGAISGMVKSLEDPYTVFLEPKEAKKFLEDVSGRFEGVGMEIGIRKGQLQVIAPLEGTPAKRAGLRPGDKIVKIEDVLTSDITIDEAVNLIRGPRGESITLTIARKEWTTTKDIPIVRDIIEIPSLKWELKDNQTAYLQLYHFTEKARVDFDRTAVEILNSPAEKIILDLRNNPGGYLEVAQHIAGWFLEKNEIVAIEDFGKEQKEYKSFGPNKLLPYPIVVLVNEGSASAAEILSGALRDNREAQLIGKKTFGKGSVQQLERLRDGSSLKITIAKWLTPKGELIADKGLIPDVEIEMTEQDYEEELDPQLDRAIEIINAM